MKMEFANGLLIWDGEMERRWIVTIEHELIVWNVVILLIVNTDFLSTTQDPRDKSNQIVLPITSFFSKKRK